MKRFLLFAGLENYPAGGWRDFQIDGDRIHDLVNYYLTTNNCGGMEWLQIVDTETMKPVLPIDWGLEW